MTEKIKVPVWFWVIAIVALIWNLLGVFAYIEIVTMSPEDLAVLPANERELYENTPVWATSAFAVAVWGGALGSILLLLRKSLATIVFIISLIGIILQNINSFLITNSWEVFGPGDAAMVVMIIAFAVVLILFSRIATRKGWSS